VSASQRKHFPAPSVNALSCNLIVTAIHGTETDAWQDGMIASIVLLTVMLKLFSKVVMYLSLCNKTNKCTYVKYILSHIINYRLSIAKAVETCW